METRILVIEDDPPSLELMGYLLRAFDYTPITLGNGEEGLESARSIVPDMILCDIQLPGVDGHEVARRLESDPVLRTVPLVAVTALAMVGDRDKVLASGFDGYLSKPVVPETFVKQVEVFLPLERRKGLRENTEQEEAAPPPPTRRLEKGTILVVDDLPTNIDVFSSVLVPCGFTVIAADDVEAAVQVARSNSVDLIVSDVHLRNESGFDLLELVKADPQLQSIPFIFVSSTAATGTERAAALALGAEAFVVRPIDPPALVAAIEVVVSKRRAGKVTDPVGAIPRGTAHTGDE